MAVETDRCNRARSSSWSERNRGAAALHRELSGTGLLLRIGIILIQPLPSVKDMNIYSPICYIPIIIVTLREIVVTLRYANRRLIKQGLNWDWMNFFLSIAITGCILCYRNRLFIVITNFQLSVIVMCSCVRVHRAGTPVYTYARLARHYYNRRHPFIFARAPSSTFVTSTALRNGQQRYWPHSCDRCCSLILMCRRSSPCWQSCEYCKIIFSSLRSPLLSSTQLSMVVMWHVH